MKCAIVLYWKPLQKRDLSMNWYKKDPKLKGNQINGASFLCVEIDPCPAALCLAVNSPVRITDVQCQLV